MHQIGHHCGSRRSNRNGQFLLPKTNTNCYKASFLPSALLDFNENYNNHEPWVCVCASRHLLRLKTEKTIGLLTLNSDVDTKYCEKESCKHSRHWTHHNHNWIGYIFIYHHLALVALKNGLTLKIYMFCIVILVFLLTIYMFGTKYCSCHLKTLFFLIFSSVSAPYQLREDWHWILRVGRAEDNLPGKLAEERPADWIWNALKGAVPRVQDWHAHQEKGLCQDVRASSAPGGGVQLQEV